MQHGALGELYEHFSVTITRFLRMEGGIPEGGLRICKAVGFQLHRLTSGILADKYEITIVRDQHLAILAPISTDLLSVGGEPSVV